MPAAAVDMGSELGHTLVDRVGLGMNHGCSVCGAHGHGKMNNVVKVLKECDKIMAAGNQSLSCAKKKKTRIVKIWGVVNRHEVASGVRAPGMVCAPKICVRLHQNSFSFWGLCRTDKVQSFLFDSLSHTALV